MKEKLVGFTLVPLADSKPVLPPLAESKPVPVVPPLADSKPAPVPPLADSKPREKKTKKLKPDLFVDHETPPKHPKRLLWHLMVHRVSPPRTTGHYFARERDAFEELFNLVSWIGDDIGLTVAIDSVRGGVRFVAERRSGEWKRVA
jgi:hypothetical protein